MSRSLLIGWVSCVATFVFAPFVGAAQLPVASYDMNNGDGTASGGNYNYWDLNYSGSGATNVDNAPLSGGVGDLTDGIIATDNWLNVEVAAGTGPYVGWRVDATPQPTVTFHLASPAQIDSVTVYVDDSNNNGGVLPPASVDIGPAGGPYTNFTTPDPPGSAPTSYTFSNLGLSGSSVELRFNYLSSWVFVSEVTIDGIAVPEPVSTCLGAIGFAALSIRRQRANRRAPMARTFEC